jgi:hypothetical protein
MGSSLLTNGMRLTHEVNTALVCAQLNRLSVSVYSSDIAGFWDEAQASYLLKILSAVVRLEPTRIRFKVTNPVHLQYRHYVHQVLETLHAMRLASE